MGDTGAVDDVVSWTTAATLVLGFASGVLAGMFGIGGAVITTPSIRVLGATPIQAVGSTVPAILPGSISGAYRYWREGLVDWRVGLICGGTGALFAAAGAKLDDLVNAHYLMILTAGLLALSGVSIIRTADVADTGIGAERLPAAGPEGDLAEAIPVATHPDLAPTPEPVTPDDRSSTSGVTGSAISEGPGVSGVASVGVLAVVGGAAGLLAGLLGVGGGIVMLPAFTGVLRMPIKLAIGSSLVAVAMFSVPALITHTALGHIAWRFALPLMIGVVPGAQVGARISVGSSDKTMRNLFGSFILVLSVIYGTTEILALR